MNQTQGAPSAVPEDDMTGLNFFVAGIMQGSHAGATLHCQTYRTRLGALLPQYFRACNVYDPHAEHAGSLEYDDATGRAVFLHHNQMCRDVDVLVAFVPEASMGTAIEMWEAFRHDRVVIAISPLAHNWTVRFCSHVCYADFTAFEQALRSGELQRKIRRWRS